jgi:hypothetical protein
MEKDRVSLPASFVALTVNVEVPAAVGVPEITPVSVFSVNPSGSVPLSRLHVIGVSPDAMIVWLYAASTVPPGNAAVVIVGDTGAGLIVMLNCCVSFPAPFVALTVNVEIPAAVGVPEITPVSAFSVSPSGSAPLSILHVMGASPDAMIV